MIRHTVVLTALGLMTAATTVGCGDSKKPYGNAMQPQASSDMTPSMPAPTVVPTGATQLSTGTYDQIRFKVPGDSGAIYIFDQDTGKVVGMTNSVASNAGESKTMADLSNTTQGLSTTDHYRIYFAPTHPTTMPIPGTKPSM